MDMDSQPIDDPIVMTVDFNSPGRKTLILGESDSDTGGAGDTLPVPEPTHDYFEGTFFCWIFHVLKIWVDVP